MPADIGIRGQIIAPEIEDQILTPGVKGHRLIRYLHMPTGAKMLIVNQASIPAVIRNHVILRTQISTP